MTKTTDQLIQDFLNNGGEIELLDEVKYEHRYVVGSTVKKIPVLKTLPEAEHMYGKKQVKKKKIKKPDYTNINMDLIPDHLKKLLKVEESATGATKEEHVETNKNNRGTEASNEG